ncbi:hypothetical protein [Mycobacterium sp. 94-17]|uniref:hypothetical protein n=1 Tax=Mycobacterium sp. 94-17 TaxID=2986147 RepID=UPI002D1EE951|nr:hypothetical protein [Mycobacterium sp. 94-17]MEB4209544.1 hypothetical protein [Mycobacterium sp. 94-17]
MRFNNPFEIGWQLNALDAIMLSSTIFILVYSIRQYRNGRPTYLVLYLACLAYGLIMEFTTGMMISRSYIQGEFAVMVQTKELLGYPTDMPLYVVVAFYPVTIFLGFKLIESFGIRSILARALSVGLIMVVTDAPYEVNGPQKGIDWWVWLDWRISGRALFQFFYGWPWSEAWWQLTWPGLMMFMVWHWEKRRSLNRSSGEGANDFDPAAIAAVKATPWKTLLITPLALGLLMNVLGILFSFPTGISIGLGIPHFVLGTAYLIAIAALFLYTKKDPIGLDRAGWTLLGIHVVGYTMVTLSTFAFRPVPTGQITIAFVTLSAIVILAAYPGHVAHQRVRASHVPQPIQQLTEVP